MAGVLMKRGTHSPPEPSEGTSPVHTLILGLWTPELGKNPFLPLKPPGEPVSEFRLHPGALPAGRQACPLKVPGAGKGPEEADRHEETSWLGSAHVVGPRSSEALPVSNVVSHQQTMNTDFSPRKSHHCPQVPPGQSAISDVGYKGWGSPETQLPL